MIDLEAIRRRADSAIPGPWYWDGYVANGGYINLCTAHSGIVTIMSCRRKGMQGAQFEFIDRDGDEPWNKRSMVNRHTLFRSAEELAIFEVCPDATSVNDPRVYRTQVNGLRSANATFIAHARQDIDDLLALVDELQSRLDKQEAA